MGWRGRRALHLREILIYQYVAKRRSLDTPITWDHCEQSGQPSTRQTGNNSFGSTQNPGVAVVGPIQENNPKRCTKNHGAETYSNCTCTLWKSQPPTWCVRNGEAWQGMETSWQTEGNVSKNYFVLDCTCAHNQSRQLAKKSSSHSKKDLEKELSSQNEP